MLHVLVTQKTIEAENICSFELQSADGGELPAFSAGAHIDVHLANGLVRQYSLCNHPKERHRYLIAVLRDSQSRGGSQALHASIEPGQHLTIGTPRNLFPLVPAARNHLLFAGGIGITPMLAMAQELAESGEAFELHYSFRSPERAAFLDMLQSEPFKQHVVAHDDTQPGSRLDAATLLQAPAADLHLYVCGPATFMNYVLESAAAAGWAAANLHREYFAAAPQPTATDLSFEVELARSGRTFFIPAERSVFEVLDEAGVEIDSSCEQGICGSCITGVLQGIPDHRDQFMTSAEHARNDRFTPCCSRAKSPRLVLDL